MSGLVGSSDIRTDLRRSVIDKLDKPFPAELNEGQPLIERSHIVQPFERTQGNTHIDLNRFYELFEKILTKARELDGLEYTIKFTTEYPNDDSILPCFTTELLDRDCFTANRTKEYSPRQMREYPDPDYPGGVVTEYLRRMENLVQLTVWTKTSKERNKLAEWTEEKFYQYLWAIQWGGVGHPVVFEGRKRDLIKDIKGNLIHGAPLQFKVITQEIIIKRSTQLRKLWLSLGING